MTTQNIEGSISSSKATIIVNNKVVPVVGPPFKRWHNLILIATVVFVVVAVSAVPFVSGGSEINEAEIGNLLLDTSSSSSSSERHPHRMHSVSSSHRSDDAAATATESSEEFTYADSDESAATNTAAADDTPMEEGK